VHPCIIGDASRPFTADTNPGVQPARLVARSAQEEDALIDENGKIAWVLERQTRYNLVR
jgi:hypothetical protein